MQYCGATDVARGQQLVEKIKEREKRGFAGSLPSSEHLQQKPRNAVLQEERGKSGGLEEGEDEFHLAGPAEFGEDPGKSINCQAEEGLGAGRGRGVPLQSALGFQSWVLRGVR